MMAMFQAMMESQAKSNREMMTQMMEMVRPQPQEARDHQPRENNPSRQNENRLDMRNFTRIKEFEGGEENFREWADKVAVTSEAVCPGIRNVFAKYFNARKIGKTLAYHEYGIEHPEMRSKELYNVLCTLTEGAAKTVIKDCLDGMDAWYTLWQTYNRRTLAKSLRKYKEAIIPKTASHSGEVIARITEWESKVRDLHNEEGVTLDPMIMLATLTEICTPDIRDMIYQQGDATFKDKSETTKKDAFGA